jgi:hypothetical protein
MCRSAAAKAMAAQVESPSEAKRIEAPRPSATIPTFSIEWKASRRLRSCCTSA